MSKKASSTETYDETESLVDVVNELENSNKGEVGTMAANGKMGLTKYLKKYPQSTYVAALLKAEYAMEFHTVDEWNAIVEELLSRKVTK